MCALLWIRPPWVDGGKCTFSWFSSAWHPSRWKAQEEELSPREPFEGCRKRSVPVLRGASHLVKLWGEGFASLLMGFHPLLGLL